MDEEKSPLISTPHVCACESCHHHGCHSFRDRNLEHDHDRAHRRRFHKKRFFKFFVAGLLLFFAFKALLHDALKFRRERGGRRHNHWRHGSPKWGEHSVTSGLEPVWPIPPELTIDHCAEWPESDEEPSWNAGQDYSEYPHDIESLTDTFELPISADQLFLLSRGPLSIGKVEVVQSDELTGDSAVVSVTTNYRPLHVLKYVQLCQLKGREGEHGVGIFSVHDRHRHDHHEHHTHIDFHVKVILPKGPSGSPLSIKDFTTNMGLFSHNVGDLADSVHFDSISLKGSMLPISVESLSGGKVTVMTANSPIEGKFSAKDSLKLETVNAHIDVDVSLYNNKSSASPTSVHMRTANAPITGSVSLFTTSNEKDVMSSSSSSSGGNFTIHTHTSLAPINLHIPTAPSTSTLTLSALTSLAPIDVRLHETYEGIFELLGSGSGIGRQDVLVDEDVEDPEGGGRKRVVSWERKGRGVVRGSVVWGEEGEGDGDGGKRGKGRVVLKTTLADVTLRL